MPRTVCSAPRFFLAPNILESGPQENLRPLETFASPPFPATNSCGHDGRSSGSGESANQANGDFPRRKNGVFRKKGPLPHSSAHKVLVGLETWREWAGGVEWYTTVLRL